ncbi:MAG TPA: response regulator transcription factor [Bdellovibrionota bacterium]|jgi:two-component system phosphate regulon response regulator PhoB
MPVPSSNNSKPHILVVDDDAGALRSVEQILATTYEVSTASDAEKGLRLAAALKPALIILDIEIGTENGVDLCEALRRESQTRDIPVLMLTGFGETEIKAKAFAAGADDYIEKPANAPELLSRVASKLRRWDELKPTQEASAKTIRCGSITLVPNRHEAMISGETVPFSTLEFQLLRTFVENPEKIVSREYLLNTVWKGVKVGKRTIDSHLVNLRKQLSRSEFELANVYGAGFIMRRRQDSAQ